MRHAPLLFWVAMTVAANMAVASPRKADLPPNNIIEHYKWCLLPKYRRASIARLEGFWRKYHPVNEEYGDAIDGRFVRLCAYRLTALYIADGQKAKASEMLGWLEANDSAFPK